jgi:hypothetical protein
MSQQTSITSIVYNVPYAKQLGIPPYYYRYRSCNPNFPNRTQTSVGGFTPADQYQKLKIIQNTVRADASLYTANLGPLSAYRNPSEKGLHGVCWNQMSDRPIPSVQRASIPTGFATSMNRRHTSVTSSKPGSQTPGGIGCDIKHNSYDRYLNRLKGKGPMRRGVVPPTFGQPIPFNPAFPVYGGKTTKTNIVNNCNCPQVDNNNASNAVLYDNPNWQEYPSGNISFNVGDYVYAVQTNTTYYAKATVTAKSDSNIYTIQFEDGATQTASINELMIYFPCDSTTIPAGVTFPASRSTLFNTDCVILKESLLI